MDWLISMLGKSLLLCIQALPLRLVARLGQVGGILAYGLDARHRRVARRNIAMCFPEKSSDQVRALAKANFRRIGEAYACAVKTASMTTEELRPHLEVNLPAAWADCPPAHPPRNVVVAIGHFGNFELFAHAAHYCPVYQAVTTYRALRPDSVNRLLQVLREKSGCLYFERRFEGTKLRAVLNRPGILLGLLSDQDGGDRGLHLPFLGHDCSTSPAPALFAVRYDCQLYTAVCYRVELARWRIESGKEIPTHEAGRRRSAEAVMQDVNTAFEAAVCRDPANWFWVHNRWKRGQPQPPDPPATGRRHD